MSVIHMICTFDGEKRFVYLMGANALQLGIRLSHYSKRYPLGPRVCVYFIKNNMCVTRNCMVVFFLAILVLLILICDVISEKVPYCGKNIVVPDQTPRIMRGVSSGPSIFFAHEHLKETFSSLRVQCYKKNTTANV